MKNLILKSCSFLFVTVNGDGYEVRVEKRIDGVKEFNVFVNGNYKTSYPMRINANQTNAELALDMYFKGLPVAIRLASLGY